MLQKSNDYYGANQRKPMGGYGRAGGHGVRSVLIQEFAWFLSAHSNSADLMAACIVMPLARDND